MIPCSSPVPKTVTRKILSFHARPRYQNTRLYRTAAASTRGALILLLNSFASFAEMLCELCGKDFDLRSHLKRQILKRKVRKARKVGD